MTLKIGTFVWFYLRDLDSQNHQLVPLPAIVYRVHNEVSVDLCVFSDDGAVPFTEACYTDQENPQYKHWTFPPHVLVQPGGWRPRPAVNA